MDALYGRAMQTTILKEYKRVRTGLWSAAPVRPRAKPPLRAPALVLNGHGFGGAVDGARRRSKSTSAFLPSNRVTCTPPTHWPRYRAGRGRPVPWQQAQRSHCPTRCVRECAQLLVQQDEAASAIKYYEAAQRLHADDGEFNDIHVNALAELYLIEKMYPKVDQLISATRARADPEVEFPMDLVVKQGIAQIHMGRFDMAEVGRWARGTCAPIQVTKRSPYPRAVRLGPLARKRWRRCSPASLSASPTCSWKSRPRTWSANIMPVPSRGSAPPSKAPRSVAHHGV